MNPRRQQGFTLVAAVFLLVVLAAMSAYIVRVGAIQASGPTTALQSSRALQAAGAGLEWGLALTRNLNTCPSPALADTNIPFTALGLAGFRVSVSFQCSEHQENTQTLVLFTINALGEFGVYGTPDYVSRRLQVTVANTGP